MKLAERTLILHVGNPKCGSTSLQAVFPQVQTAKYLGKTKRIENSKIVSGRFENQQIEQFCRNLCTVYDVRLVDKAPYQEAFERAFEVAPNNRLLLSDEILSSIAIRPGKVALSLPQIVENFQRTIDCRVEVMLVVREQFSFLKSYFQQLPHHDYLFSEFLALVALRKKMWIYPALDYERIASVMEKQVDAFHLLPFEDLFSGYESAWNLLKPIGLEEIAEVLFSTHRNKSSEKGNFAQELAARRAVFKDITPNKLPLGLNSDEMKFLNNGESIYRKYLIERFREARRVQILLKEARQAGLPPVEDVFYVPEDLRQHLANDFGAWNSRLQQKYSNMDWGAMGYILN